MIPILKNHDVEKIIGGVDGNGIATLLNPIPLDGLAINYGITVLEYEIIAGVKCIKKFKFLELSLGPDLNNEKNIKEMP